MERIEVNGTAYTRDEESIPDDVPQSVVDETEKETLVKTDIGVFVLKSGSVENYLPPFDQLRVDWDDYSAVGSENVELIKMRDALLHKGSTVSNRLYDGDVYLIDIKAACDTLDGLSNTDTKYIAVIVEDTVWTNTTHDINGLEFLSQNFDHPLFTEDDEPLNDYPVKSEAHVLKRISETTLEQRAVIQSDTVKQLAKDDAILELEIVGPSSFKKDRID